MGNRAAMIALLGAVTLFAACGDIDEAGVGEEEETNAVEATTAPEREEPPEPTEEDRPTEADAAVADVDMVREWVTANFQDASWFEFIQNYEATQLWVEVKTALFPDADAREPGLGICRAVSQAPHEGEGFLPVRVVGTNGEKIADNLGFGNVEACEAKV